MKRFVFWTGIYNIVAGAAFLFPGLVAVLGIDAPESAFWCRLPALFVIFLGLVLVLCSRDLARRGSIVYWEGILRIGASPVLAGYGYFDDLGIMLVVLGAIDLLIGLVYLVAMPRALQMTAKQLLFDMK